MQSSQLIAKESGIRQRSDLTFKYNATLKRHGWLRLTPAYSVKVVDAILRRQNSKRSVLDPFSGTSTTSLCAAYEGCQTVSMDINPFLVWFGQTKLRRYSPEALCETKQKARTIQSLVDQGNCNAVMPPPIANIERWWDRPHLDYLCKVKAAIESQHYKYTEAKDLLLVAFCRLVIDSSNAAFNHQSMSFQDNPNRSDQPLLWMDTHLDRLPFAKYVYDIIESASYNPVCDAKIMLGDARELDGLSEMRFDLIITSPPYPNRMSYIRELRPYMYWLGYLDEARQAGELDWQAVGGTWGIATSRLREWRRDAETFFPEYLDEILQCIASSSEKSGELMSKYVGKYFEDMWIHFQAVRSVMNPGGELHYIIGNSKFYNCLVPAERIYADMLRKVGFQKVDIQVIRKRNSKKELFEFDVVASK